MLPQVQAAAHCCEYRLTVDQRPSSILCSQPSLRRSSAEIPQSPAEMVADFSKKRGAKGINDSVTPNKGTICH